jgi:pimeloyl-ACP methyl ester carboxylesterase
VKEGGKYVISKSTPVYYQGPDTFVRIGSNFEEDDKAAPSRVVEVVVRDANSIDKELANGKIDLHRPPILAVHGIWSGPETWKAFENQLNGKGQFTIVRADYSKKGSGEVYDEAGPFSQNYPVIGDYIPLALNKAKAEDQRIVANKVDIVAHSMGGLLVREYCRQEPEACKKQIRKLITIDTPHRGSDLADWLWLHEKDKNAFYNQLAIRGIRSNQNVAVEPRASQGRESVFSLSLRSAVGSNALDRWSAGFFGTEPSHGVRVYSTATISGVPKAVHLSVAI